MFSITNYSLISASMQPLSLSIDSGEVVQLRGRNGTGKTSLLQRIAGLDTTRTSCDCLDFDGKSLHTLDPDQRVKLGIVLMHQHPITFKKLTLQDLITSLQFNTSYRDEYISSLELNQYLHTPLHSVSGGESKRIECLVSLLLQPRLLLLDEPDSGTDIHSTACIGSVIARHHQRYNTAILYVTHSGNISTWLRPTKTINLNSLYEHLYL
jgi:Fe-S cluster assembly ATP-binding protein